MTSHSNPYAGEHSPSVLFLLLGRARRRGDVDTIQDCQKRLTELGYDVRLLDPTQEHERAGAT